MADLSFKYKSFLDSPNRGPMDNKTVTRHLAQASAKKQAVAKVGAGGYSPVPVTRSLTVGQHMQKCGITNNQRSTMMQAGGVWRLKPCPGSRRTIKNKISNTNPKQSWDELVAIIRELNP